MKLLGTRDVAERIGCGMDTARTLMAEMTMIRISPASCRRPRYGVSECDFQAWLDSRKTLRNEPKKERRFVSEYRLEYRKSTLL